MDNNNIDIPVTEYGVNDINTDALLPDESVQEDILPAQVSVKEKPLDVEPQPETVKKTTVKEQRVEPKPDKEEDRTEMLDVYDVLQCVFVAIVAGILIFLLLGRVVGVEGSSMFPTLHEGDRLIVSNLFYDPSYGDIIILKSESYDHALVKRVIATEGQTIDIDFENGVVYVDDKAVYEPYIYEKTYTSEGFEGPVTVPEGCVFVMGDNRNDSSDSRKASIGFIDERQILGKAYLLIFPGADYDRSREWSRIGSLY